MRRELGFGGDVDVDLHTRPVDARQVDSWLDAFRTWLVANRAAILQDGGEFPTESPQQVRMRLAAMQATDATDHQLEVCRAELQLAEDLAWLRACVRLEPSGHRWLLLGIPTGQHVAHRRENDLDELVLHAVARKCKQAAGYPFDGPLWLLLRNAMHAEVSLAIADRMAALPGVDRFSEVWVLEVPANLIDCARPARVRRLLRN